MITANFRRLLASERSRKRCAATRKTWKSNKNLFRRRIIGHLLNVRQKIYRQSDGKDMTQTNYRRGGKDMIQTNHHRVGKDMIPMIHYRGGRDMIQTSHRCGDRDTIRTNRRRGSDQQRQVPMVTCPRRGKIGDGRRATLTCRRRVLKVAARILICRRHGKAMGAAARWGQPWTERGPGSRRRQI